MKRDYISPFSMTVDKKKGWAVFDEETAWAIYDFVKFELNGYETLVFWSYFCQGYTLEEIGNMALCHFSGIAKTIKNIEKRLKYFYEHRHELEIPR